MTDLMPPNTTIDELMCIIEELINDEINCANNLIDFSKCEMIDYFPDFKIDPSISQFTQHELFYYEK